MSRVCELCGKRTQIGNAVCRRGLAKRLGGVGRKVTSKVKREYRPNLQYIRIIDNGRVRRIRICTKCIKAGKYVKPARKSRMQKQAAPSA
jgi:large subunit ribosomal protein L28